jgi:predicted nucleic acid-binding protein
VGVGEIEAAITDAGPLIHLAEIGCLSLLRVFQMLHIPDAVWQETVGQGRVPGTSILQLGNVSQHTVPNISIARFVQENALSELHGGEQEGLYLCREMDIPLLLTDDLAAREAAKRLGITPIGSLGIVVKAYHLGQIALEEAERYIAALYDVSSLYVTRTIVELAIEQLRNR